MLPLMLDMYVRRLGEAGAPLHPRIESEINNHLGFVDGTLAGRDYLLGAFSLADIQMSFVGEAGGMLGRLAGHEHLAAWVRRCQDRPAYRVALEKGGPYNMGPKD
jgi:glutathione S-transferase